MTKERHFNKMSFSGAQTTPSIYLQADNENKQERRTSFSASFLELYDEIILKYWAASWGRGGQKLVWTVGIELTLISDNRTIKMR